MLLLFILSAQQVIAAAESASSVRAYNTTPRAALSSSCVPNCTVSGLSQQWTWSPASVTATLTAATIVYIINNRTNTTSTSTIYNDLPSGVTMPPTNSAGSHIAVITAETAFNETEVVTLTFPTGLIQEPVDYTWAGTLPTTGPMGQSVCSTGSAVIPYSSGTFTFQTVASPTSADDPGGILWWLAPDGCYMPPNPTLNPTDAAISLCTAVGICAAQVKVTASLFTDTSTTHIDSPATTSQPAIGVNNGVTSSAAARIVASQTPSSGANSNPGSGSGQGQQGQQGQGGNGNSAGPGANPPGGTPVTSTIPPPVVIGSSTFSATTVAGGSTAFVIGGQTLGLGSTITVGSGAAATTIALVTSGGNTEVVVNGKTQTLPPPTTTTVTPGVGSAIMSGLSGSGHGSSATGAPLFTGNADGRTPPEFYWIIIPMTLLLHLQLFNVR